MDISTEMKGLIFDLLQKPVALDELAHADLSIDQRSELYLASCLIVDADNCRNAPTSINSRPPCSCRSTWHAVAIPGTDGHRAAA